MSATETDAAPLGYPETASKGLKGGALGLLSSVVVGTASTAPAYSLAASLGFVVAGGGAILAGVKAPAIILLAFVPMYLIALAYQELNKAEPDCGTTFTWATRAFGPVTGWLGGWGIVAADVIVMANLAQIAGSYSFTFLGDLGWDAAGNLDSSTTWTTVAGLVWIAVMTWICYRGIEVSARIQYVLLSVEILVLIIFSAVALGRVYSGNGVDGSLHPAWSWLWPGGLSVADVIAPALLTAVFIYWGWDTAVSVNEESDDPARTPGRAAILSTLLLLVTYALVSIAAVAFAGVGTTGIGLGNPDNADDVFRSIGPVLFGSSTLGHIGLLLLSASILTSASASTQTTILPTARTTLSMAVYKAIPTSFAKIHPRFLTPTVSTIAMGLASMLFYGIFTVISPSLLTALVGSVGLMIAFYYGLTGFACSWFYRRTLHHTRRDFFMQGVLPSLGGLILLVAFVYALKSYAEVDWLTDDDGNNVTIFGFGAVAVVGVVAILLGLVLMVVWRLRSPAFFKGQTLPRRGAHDLVLAGPETVSEPVFRLPDSGLPGIVIARDLSNLPEGATAVDASTREEVEDEGTP
ncbi:APC family permease [Cellulomonas alba]|uniref:APC family permease n=1 Tax=Cellulomonas alba TaxID=3053467 RepID=A0ABT7SKN0_9CELL|nr:APC family permease [Cellulomonas alba]MDM7856097.1 APC family permease [Cellulomonas alba]